MLVSPQYPSGLMHLQVSTSPRQTLWMLTFRKSPSQPNWHKTQKPPKPPYLNGARTLRMSFQKTPMTFYPHINHMITPLTSNCCLPPRSPKYTHQIPKRVRHVGHSLINTSRLAASSPSSHPKLHCFSLFQKKMGPFTHVKTITILTCTPSTMHTPYPLSLNSSMT